MKKQWLTGVLSVSLLMGLPGCSTASGTSPSQAILQPAGSIVQQADAAQPPEEEMAGLLSSYYAPQADTAFTYFQNASIQNFLAMWVEQATGDIAEPEWDLRSFTSFEILDHDMQPITQKGGELYYCTFSDGDGRYGYVIFAYYEDDPSIENFGVHETTPYEYDLRANIEAIEAELANTDLDLATTTAQRASWLDTKNNRSDQILLFRDESGSQYLCIFGDGSFEMEKVG